MNTLNHFSNLYQAEARPPTFGKGTSKQAEWTLATPNDLKNITHLIPKHLQESDVPPEDYEQQHAKALSHLEKALASPDDSAVIVLKDEQQPGKILGMGLLAPLSKIYNFCLPNPKEAYVGMGFVRQAYRGKGYGLTGIQRRIEEAMKKGYQTVFCMASNVPMLRRLEKFGFKAIDDEYDIMKTLKQRRNMTGRTLCKMDLTA